MQSVPRFDSLARSFSSYRQRELVAVLAGLQICPDNHSQRIRLETACRIACSMETGGDREVNCAVLADELNRCFAADESIQIMEDPLEDLFTRNVVFHRGNYTVYGDVGAGDDFILQNLLYVLAHHSEDLPSQFVRDATRTSLALLCVINEVARRAGHMRYMDSPDRCREEIQIPSVAMIGRLSRAVFLEQGEISTLLRPSALDRTALQPFTSSLGDTVFLEPDPLKNPLFCKPFVEINGAIIVAAPGAGCVAARHFVWALSQEYEAANILAERFREILWANVTPDLVRMCFQPVESDLPPHELPISAEEGVFRIDVDKLAYVQLIADDACDYRADEPNGMHEIGSVARDIENRCEQITEWLIAQDFLCCRRVLVLLIYGSIGRQAILCLRADFANSRMLFMRADELSVVVSLGDNDSLALWKYAGAEKRLQDSTRVISFAFLDTYALYVQHNHSFYLGDGPLPHMVSIVSGSGRLLRGKGAWRTDIHSLPRGVPPRYVTVRRSDEDESIPIYISDYVTGPAFEQVVGGYPQALWVKPFPPLARMPGELRVTYYAIVTMVTYWLWQITPGLGHHLLTLGNEPIELLLNLESPEDWTRWTGSGRGTAGMFVDSKTELNERSIRLTIPSGLCGYMARPDNEWGRLVGDALMRSFADMLDKAVKEHSLDETERRSILNAHVPLGRKKRLVVPGLSASASVDPRYLPRLRKLQEHDIEEQLDGLVAALEDKAPPIGDVAARVERTELCRAMVELYHQRMQSALRDFSWQSLVMQLISYNEAICYHRARMRIMIPTTLECFGSLQSQLKNLVKDVRTTDTTALSLRTLIEAVSAEPPSGGRKVSTAELDQMLAMAHHIVNWGMISDHIHLEVSECKISILPSGRIGTEKDTMEGVWDPFIESKVSEDVESAVSAFQNECDQDDKSKEAVEDEVECNPAFKAEFGLTMKQIADFHAFMAEFGFEQETAAPQLSLSELKRKLKEVLGWPPAQLDEAIDLFSLKPRARWDSAPSGFREADIWPWRYRRRLSYVRKPLVIGPDSDGNPTVFWGPRHSERSCIQLFSLVMSGRYRLHGSSSPEMIELLGRIGNRQGKEFTRQAAEWFRQTVPWQTHVNVPIRPGELLGSRTDLGDIDILLVDTEGNRVFSLECKNINYGRSPREIKNEIDRLIGEEADIDSWVGKHQKRDGWLRRNITLLCSQYGLKPGRVRVSSLFLTSEEIPATFVRRTALPFISFTRLRRLGARLLDHL